jgi:hypothetical protein
MPVASAKADGSSVGSASVGVGAGVAINIAKIDNQAYLGGTGAITAQGVTVVRAGFSGESGETPTDNTFCLPRPCPAASGGSVGVAGALALNIVDVQSVAEVKSGADVTITGGKDARLTAENTTVSKAIAQPANEGAVAGSVGVGASVALNIANTSTHCGAERHGGFDRSEGYRPERDLGQQRDHHGQGGRKGDRRERRGHRRRGGDQRGEQRDRPPDRQRRRSEPDRRLERRGHAQGEHDDVCGRFAAGGSSAGDRDCAGPECGDGRDAGDDGADHFGRGRREVRRACVVGQQCGAKASAAGCEAGG